MDEKEERKEFDVGKAIRECREQKELSVELIAGKIGLSYEQHVEIENGKVSPALGVLIRISKALGVSVGTLMGEKPTQTFMIVRKNEMKEHFHSVSKESLGYGYSYVPLGQEKKDRYMEPFLVTFEPDVYVDDRMTVHEGEEFIYVLQGELEIILDQHREVLHPGDSIYYEGSIPHLLKCHGNIPAKIVAIIYVSNPQQMVGKSPRICDVNDDHGKIFD